MIQKIENFKITSRIFWQYFLATLTLFKSYSIFNFIRIGLRYSLIRIQYIFKVSRLVSLPPNIYLFLTKRCNLTCDFCHYVGELDSSNADSELEMTLEDVQRLESQGYFKAPSKVCFYGGEPLLNNEIIPMIKYFKGKGHLTSLITNGAYLKKKNQDLVEAGLHFMTLSYYPGITEKLEKEVSWIAQKLILNVSFIISDNNLSQLDEVIRYCIRVNAKMITIENLVEKDTCSDKGIEYSEEYKDYKRDVLLRYSSQIIFRWSDVKRSNPVTQKIQCTEPWDMMLFNKDGKVLPCCQFKLGEFHKTTESDPFNSTEMVKMRKSMINNEVPSGCEGCHYLYAKDPLYRFDV